MPRAKKELTVWFPWEGDPDGAETQFRLLDDQDIVDIQEASSTTRQYFDPASGTLKNETIINRRADRVETALRAVMDWKNYLDGDGQPMECTPENVRYWACNNGFMVHLQACQLRLRELAAMDAEEREKNVSRLPSGSLVWTGNPATSAGKPTGDTAPLPAGTPTR